MNLRRIPSGSLLLLAAALLNGCDGPQTEEETLPTEVAVQVGTIERVTLHARVHAYGTVEAEPAGGGKPGGASRLSSPAAGIVMEVPVSEGDSVEAGTVVVRLDDRAALAQVEKARQAVEFAERQMTRQHALEAFEGTSEKMTEAAAQQLDAARAELAIAEAQLAGVQLTTPLAGIVARINVQPGQTIDLNTVAAEVMDPARLVATVNVPAAEAPRLQPGQPAELLADRPEGAPVQGRVLYISPLVDPQTATTLVRLSLPPDSGLRAGQFVQARITTAEHAGTLAVPRAAVYTDHEGQSTLAIVTGNVARQLVVQVGLRDGELIEVQGDGVIEGATVVTLGAYALPPETKVRILNPPPEAR